MDERYYTVPEVAALLSLERSTITRWCQRGRFPGAHLLFRSRKLGYRIPKSDLDVLLQPPLVADGQAQVSG